MSDAKRNSFLEWLVTFASGGVCGVLLVAIILGSVVLPVYLRGTP